MKLFSIATVFGMVGAVSAQTNPCCPAVRYVEATLNDGGNNQRRLRRLQTNDPTCDTNRGTLQPYSDVTGDPNAATLWQSIGGSAYEETVFSRYAIDFANAANDNTYWREEDGATGITVPAGQRVVVINVTGAPTFSSTWATDAAACAACVTCEEPTSTWTMDDLVAGITGQKHYFVIRAPTANLQAWEGIVTSVRTKCGNVGGVENCNLAAVASTSDVNADVLAALNIMNPTSFDPAACDICLPATTTTSTSSSDSSTSSSNVSSTTAPSTTSDVSSSSSAPNGAAHIAAGIVPVALAAAVSMLM